MGSNMIEDKLLFVISEHMLSLSFLLLLLIFPLLLVLTLNKRNIAGVIVNENHLIVLAGMLHVVFYAIAVKYDFLISLHSIPNYKHAEVSILFMQVSAILGDVFLLAPVVFSVVSIMLGQRYRLGLLKCAIIGVLLNIGGLYLIYNMGNEINGVRLD